MKRLRQRLLNGERGASAVVRALHEAKQQRVTSTYDRQKAALTQKHADERAYLASFQAAEASQKRGPIQGERATLVHRGVTEWPGWTSGREAGVALAHARMDERGVYVENTVEGDLPTFLHKGQPKVLPGVAKRLAWDRDRRRRTVSELEKHQRIEAQALERKETKLRAALHAERRVEEARLRELIAHATCTVSNAEQADAHRKALDAGPSRRPRRWRRPDEIEPDRVTTETRGKASLACDAAVARASLACAALATYEPHVRAARPPSARPARPQSANADRKRLAERIEPASAPARRPQSAPSKRPPSATSRPASARRRPRSARPRRRAIERPLCGCCRTPLETACRLPKDFFFEKTKLQFCSLACAKEWNHRAGPEAHRGFRDMLVDMLVSRRDPSHAPVVEILNKFERVDRRKDAVFYRPSRSFYNAGCKIGPLSLASYDASKYTLEDSCDSVAESVKQRVGADYVDPALLKDLDHLCAVRPSEATAPDVLGSYASLTVDEVLSRHES